MKRLGLFLLAVLLALGVAACTSDDDDNGGPGGASSTSYNFNGRWMVTRTVTENPLGWAGYAIGRTWDQEFNVIQSGTDIRFVVIANDNTYSGTCNPGVRTFSVETTDPGHPTWKYNFDGTAEGTAMSGLFHARDSSNTGNYVTATFVGQRLGD